MIILTRPSVLYKDSYLQAMREFQQEGRYLNYNLKRMTDNFERFIEHIYVQEERDKTAPDRVPNADFWLIDDDEFIGRLSLRYKLNDYLLHIGGTIGYEIRPSKRCQGYGKEILRIGLQEAKKAGLRRALVTCNEDNIGSKKVIEHNGGQLENAVPMEGTAIKKLRYWVELS
jgi:predicted acetyltransferase